MSECRPARPRSRSPRQLLAAFQRAMLDCSPDALADLFAADAVYEFPFLAPQRETDRYDGREAIRAGFTRAWGAASRPPLTGFRDVRVHDSTDPEVLVAEHELDAVNTATGRAYTSGFVLVLRAHHGEIVHARDYADVLRVASGLGRLPELLDSLREQPAAYALSEVTPRDPDALAIYRDLAARSIAAYGGRYLVRGGEVEAVEGAWPVDRSAVLVEFPSRRRLREWYASPDYAQALAVRDAALERRLTFLDAPPANDRREASQDRRGDDGPVTPEALGRRLYAALDAQDWSQLETLVAPDVVVQVGSSAPMGLRDWRRSQKLFFDAFADAHHVIEDCIAAGDRLVTRGRFEGTHSATFAETQPTGARVSVGVIHIDRFRDERLVEHHGQLDTQGLLQQIGAG